MNETANKALLPAGLQDMLPPDAEFEAAMVGRLMSVFARHGYERVKPPLIEFEDSLLSGPGTAIALETFRLMDPVSQRMMAVRSDMTLQIARIATSRLKNSPRPLRLSYAGQVLRVRGGQLRPERQFGQAGVELIGAVEATADAEVVLLAVAALNELGVPDLSVDLYMPTLVSALFTGLDLPQADLDRLRQALDRKDTTSVKAIAGDRSEALVGVLDAGGLAETALDRLAALDLPADAAQDRARLADVVGIVRNQIPSLPMTIDAVENRGFEYHTGTSFTLFARNVRGELGRGGRYVAGDGDPATGFTLFTDSLLRALPAPETGRRLFLPHGTSVVDRQRFQDDGWVTVCGLAEVADIDVEARRLGCSHVVLDDAAMPVKGK